MSLAPVRQALTIALEELQREGCDTSNRWEVRRCAFLVRCAIATIDAPHLGVLWWASRRGWSLPTARDLIALEAAAAGVDRPYEVRASGNNVRAAQSALRTLREQDLISETGKPHTDDRRLIWKGPKAGWAAEWTGKGAP